MRGDRSIGEDWSGEFIRIDDLFEPTGPSYFALSCEISFTIVAVFLG